MGSKHALLSASGSERWLECTPSARFELQFPKQTSAYAEEGTAAHELCELSARYWLDEITEKKYENTLSKLSKGEYYNAEMQECAVAYAELVKEITKEVRKDCPDAFVELEAKSLDFSEYAPEGFGTGDCIVVADDILHIIDFKYGKGVRVDAEGNSQMRLYAIGAINRYKELYDINKVRVSIFQPRISKYPSTDEIDVSELFDWAENYVKPRAALAFAGEGEFFPSNETCKFCRAKSQCKARATKNLELFDNAPDLLVLSLEEASNLLEKSSDIKTWLADLEAFVTSALFNGEEVDAWKLVTGKSNRKITDSKKAVDLLVKNGADEKSLYKPQELISITALEKLFGKKFIAETLEEVIVKPQGAPTLASIKDKRPAINPKELLLKEFDKE